MALTITGTATAPDTWRFTVAGVVPAVSPTFVIDYGDGTAPVTVTTDASGTTVITHQYRVAGHWVYTVTATATITAFASTLNALNVAIPTTLQAINTTPGLDTLAAIPATSATVSMQATVDVGPATIWATVVPGTPIQNIQIDTYVNSPGNVLLWTITRNTPSGSAPLYTGSSSSYAVSLIDYTAPIGVDITYTLTITGTDYSTTIVLSNTVRLTGTLGCFLTDPISGKTLAVELQSWPTRTRTARRAVLEVMNRADPVAISDTHLYPAGAWVFITRTDVATADLIDLLTRSTYAVLRSQPDSSIATVTVSVGDIAETRYTGQGGDQRRLNGVLVQEIAALPATALPIPSTLNGLSTMAATLGALSQLRPTLLQLSQIITGSGPA